LGITGGTGPYPTGAPRRSNDGTQQSISKAQQPAFEVYQAALRPNNTTNTNANFMHQLTPLMGLFAAMMPSTPHTLQKQHCLLRFVARCSFRTTAATNTTS